MLELARDRNVPILLSSTSEVYGDPEINPQVEEYLGRVSCTGPRACYDEGKRAAEASLSITIACTKLKSELLVFSTPMDQEWL